MQMYNLETNFKTFYGKHVVLSKDKKTSLFTKKNINVNRLKEGLKDYNEENKTDYKLAEEPIVQGSVAMSTVTQNAENDYDIDVAIVFESDNLPEGTQATKNLVLNAIKRKAKNFAKEPEALTNCIRIVYMDGYHIDFAIYRRTENIFSEGYTYEHCGSEWRKRDPRAITKWFFDQNKERDYKLRDVVRLMKVFSKSEASWVNMPGGLIQSVLADENFKLYDRMDERFYYTMVAIKDRLLWNKEVVNPTDASKSLKLVSKDNHKMNNLYSRLKKSLEKLDVLFEDTCTWKQAVDAWTDFFEHDYWYELLAEEITKALSATKYSEQRDIRIARETEEHIEYIFPVQIKYQLHVECKVYRGETFISRLSSLLSRHRPLLPNHTLFFEATTTVPTPYDVYWKVKNQGEVAIQEDCIRGEVKQTDKLTHVEPTQFRGNHYVECYIVKDGVCVAKNRVDVPIKI